MHTKLPEFIEKMKKAVKKNSPDKNISIKGLENLSSAKMQSLRTGRIEHAVEELASIEDVEHVEMVVIPRVPETMHTVIVKGVDKDGNTTKAILDIINILHSSEEVEIAGAKEVEDRRPKIGLH